MKIRSITCFYDPSGSRASDTLNRLTRLAKQARVELTDTGYEVQTVRLATVAFPEMIPSCCDVSAVHLATVMEAEAREMGFDYLSLGPAMPQVPESYHLIPEMLASTQQVFVGGVIASAADGISLAAVKACGEVIAKVATITPDGFANLRFAALANVPPGSPFFPAAYHTYGAPPQFSIACEAADLVQTAFQNAGNLREARNHLLGYMEEHAEVISTAASRLSEQSGIQFGGIDFSPAPHPLPGHSLGGAMEALGVPALGLSGSLAAAAFLADTLDQGKWTKTGFNGLMLPVLEDGVLAQRAGEGKLTIRDLLMYSAVCGTGLDTIPLAGGCTSDQIAALLLDVAALGVRLDKPLTARLMPIPGKKAGDLTEFDFAYFANSRVMDLPASALTGMFASNESIRIQTRTQRKAG